MQAIDKLMTLAIDAGDMQRAKALYEDKPGLIVTTHYRQDDDHVLMAGIAVIQGALEPVLMRMDKPSGNVEIEAVWQNQGLIVERLC